MVRRLRLLLAVTFMPVVLVVFQAEVAAASPAYGPAVPGDTVTLSEADGVDVKDGMTVTCALTGQWAVDWAAGPGTGASIARTVNYKATCSTGWNISHVDLTVSVSGTGCELGAHVGEMDGTGVQSGVLGAVGYAGCTSPESPAPSISQWCASAVIDTHAGLGLDTSFTASACGDLPMGNPPVPAIDTQCDFGVPEYEITDYGTDYGNPPASLTGDNRVYIGEVEFRVFGGPTLDTSGRWYAYIVTDNQGGGGGAVGSNPGNVAFSGRSGGGTNTPTSFVSANHLVPYLRNTRDELTVSPYGVPVVSREHVVMTHSWDPPAAAYTKNPIIGVGIYRQNTSASHPGTGATSSTNQWGGGGDYPDGLSGRSEPDVARRNLVGKNIPGACAFYWGEKLYNTDANTYDTPGGPLTPAPTEPEPIPDPADPTPPGDPRDCSFSWTDPTTWATGALCELVRQAMKIVTVLGQIKDAFLGLASSIASAIVAGVESMLEALFVPDEDFLDGKLEQASELLEDSDIADYRDTAAVVSGGSWAGSGGASAPATATGSPFLFDMGSASLSGGSGCSGPVITWDYVSSDSFAPLSACAAPMSTVAGYFRSFALLALVLGAFFRGLSMMTTAMGLTKEQNSKPWRPVEVKDI